MSGFISSISHFHNQEEGATATEYVILLVLIACFLIASIALFGETVSQKYMDATNTVDTEVVISN